MQGRNGELRVSSAAAAPANATDFTLSDILLRRSTRVFFYSEQECILFKIHLNRISPTKGTPQPFFGIPYCNPRNRVVSWRCSRPARPWRALGTNADADADRTRAARLGFKETDAGRTHAVPFLPLLEEAHLRAGHR
eukprot:gene17809-biopygen838